MMRMGEFPKFEVNIVRGRFFEGKKDQVLRDRGGLLNPWFSKIWLVISFGIHNVAVCYTVFFVKYLIFLGV